MVFTYSIFKPLAVDVPSHLAENLQLIPVAARRARMSRCDVNSDPLGVGKEYGVGGSSEVRCVSASLPDAPADLLPAGRSLLLRTSSYHRADKQRVVSIQLSPE